MAIDKSKPLNELDALRMLGRIKQYFFAKTFRNDGDFHLSYGEWYRDIDMAVGITNTAMNQTRMAIILEVQKSDGCAQMSIAAKELVGEPGTIKSAYIKKYL